MPGHGCLSWLCVRAGGTWLHGQVRPATGRLHQPGVHWTRRPRLPVPAHRCASVQMQALLILTLLWHPEPSDLQVHVKAPPQAPQLNLQCDTSGLLISRCMSAALASGGWTVAAYARSAKHPRGAVIGQDIFESGAASRANAHDLVQNGYLADPPRVDLHLLCGQTNAADRGCTEQLAVT